MRRASARSGNPFNPAARSRRRACPGSKMRESEALRRPTSTVSYRANIRTFCLALRGPPAGDRFKMPARTARRRLRHPDNGRISGPALDVVVSKATREGTSLASGRGSRGEAHAAFLVSPPASSTIVAGRRRSRASEWDYQNSGDALTPTRATSGGLAVPRASGGGRPTRASVRNIDSRGAGRHSRGGVDFDDQWPSWLVQGGRRSALRQTSSAAATPATSRTSSVSTADVLVKARASKF